MRECTIIVNSKPKAQARPKFSMRGKHAVAYDPDRNTKAYAKLIIAQQFDLRLECPIELTIAFFMPISKSTSKKKHALMLSNEIKHQKLGDLDNLAKLYMDAMNDVVFADDKQVWKMSLEKRYSDNPHVEIIVSWQEQENDTCNILA
jgi:Holliday junction resolvase RusA-like endonuclease